MHINDLSGKSILLLGYGREGQAMLRAIEKNGIQADITIGDSNPALEAKGYTLQTGPNYMKNLDPFDVIIKSPGIPPNKELAAVGSKITSSTQIFLDTIKDTGVTVIGVTGSKGKSTTSSLIHAILKASGKDVDLIGNIGIPSIDYIDQAEPGKIFVLEMSSYQLMDLTVSPALAVVTSFFPEHLDYHGSLEAYKEAKKHITRFQAADDVVFFNSTSLGAQEIANESAGTKVPYSAVDAPVKIEETKLLGEHNLTNIGGAFKIAKHFGVNDMTAIEAIKSFTGLPHRLQFLGTIGGIDWVDDAISTTPESTMAALKALGNRIGTIILGGQDRGNNFGDLGDEVANSQIGHVILFPGSGPRIKQAIMDAHRVGIVFHDAPDMEMAVRTAKEVTKPGKICLLSTASPSYGMFKNFEEKGEKFAACARRS